MLTRRQFVASAALTPLISSAAAADWPQRPVRIIYPYPFGGSADAAARYVAQWLGEAFGRSFILESHAGANGTLAATAVAHAPADGYTLFWATTPQIAISPAMTKTAYDPVRDFVPISAVITNTFGLVVNSRLPVTTLAEFVDYIRARPANSTYAEGGIGSINHLAMAMFLQRAGIEMTHASYKGNVPALNDVIAGHVPTMFSLLGDALQHAASGSIRLLAVSSKQRAAQVPEVPTVSEAGYPGFNAIAWNGLMAPAGAPEAVVDRIAAEVARAMKDPAFVGRLAALGVDPLGNSPAEFSAMIRADTALWAGALRIAGVERVE